MKKIAIIGAGFAGISSYIQLASEQYEITVFETKKQLGGRSSSYIKDQISYDSGQHILMQVYTHTLELLEKMNSTPKLHFMESLSYTFYGQGNYYKLKGLSNLPAPFHILYSYLSFCKPLSFSDKLRLIIPGIFFLLPNISKNKSISAETWLRKRFQRNAHFIYLWRIIIVSIFNAEPKNISAFDFIQIFRKVFYHNRNYAKAIISKVPLSDLFTNIKSIIDDNRDKLLLSTRIVSINENENKIAIYDHRNEKYEFDYVIFSIPPDRLKTFFPIEKTDFAINGILTIYFKCRISLFDDPFVGFPEENFDWIFNFNNINNTNIYSAVVSCYDAKDISMYIEQFKVRVSDIFNIPLNEIIVAHYFKDIKATFNSKIGSKLPPHPGLLSGSKKIYICGDWTNTGLPCTIESAVLSGKIVSEKLKMIGNR